MGVSSLIQSAHHHPDPCPQQCFSSSAGGEPPRRYSIEAAADSRHSWAFDARKIGLNFSLSCPECVSLNLFPPTPPAATVVASMRRSPSVHQRPWPTAAHSASVLRLLTFFVRQRCILSNKSPPRATITTTTTPTRSALCPPSPSVHPQRLRSAALRVRPFDSCIPPAGVASRPQL